MATRPSLAVLRSFDAAARHQSFTLAAEELRVTQGAVSRQVHDLEAALGIALFRHAGRGVALTEAGRHFAERLAADLGRLRDTIAQTRAAGAGAQTLSLAVLPTFASRWIVPRLSRFRALHPNIQLAFQSRTQPFDLLKDGVDLAIHFGRKDWAGGTLTALCPENLSAVAAPDLIADHAISAPTDLSRVPLLHLISRDETWARYFAELGVDAPEAMQGMLFDQFSTMLAAATQGLGAAIVPTYLIESELQTGALQVLGQPPVSEDMYYAVLPRGSNNALAKAFRDWLCAEARNWSAALG